jgi:hypothetical protein
MNFRLWLLPLKRKSGAPAAMAWANAEEFSRQRSSLTILHAVARD